MTQSQLCTGKRSGNTLKTKEKAMTNPNRTTTKQEKYNREELGALLESVSDRTVSRLKKLYEELTGEVTRSNNKTSLIRRVSVQIQRLLDEDEISDAVESDVIPDQDLDGPQIEDGFEEEAGANEEDSDSAENTELISDESEEMADAEETEMTVTAGAEDSESAMHAGEEEDALQEDPIENCETDQIDFGAKTTSTSSRPKKKRKRDPRLPPAGTILTREYKGVHHEVRVLEDGFIYNGEHFGSLSRIAKHIGGGVSWNGYLFFRKALVQAPTVCGSRQSNH
jgi:hypothetical protein